MRSLGCNRELSIATSGGSRGVFGKAVFWAVFAGSWLLAGRVGAAPLQLAVDLDGDGQAETVALDDSGLLTVTSVGQAQGSRPRELRLELGERSPRGAGSLGGTLVEKRTRAGQLFVVATGLRAPGQRVTLWATWRAGVLQAVYNGPVGPVGSDGEYSRGIDIVDGVLMRYQTTPTVERCDGERRLFVERYTAEGTWQAVQEGLLPTVDSMQSLAVSVQGPRELPSAPLGMYRLTATNRQAGIERADLLTAPRELDDGQTQTAWRGKHDARGTFFTWRAETTGRALRALRITPATAIQGNLPKQLTLTLSAKESYRIATTPTSRPLWVVLPQPIPTSCVSLTIEDGGTRDGQWSALSEVSLFSDLDGGNALGQLVAQLGSSEMRVAEAAERALFAQLETGTPQQGEELLTAIAAGLPSSRGSTKRRYQALLGQLARQSNRLAAPTQRQILDTLLTAIATAEVDERTALFAALTTLASQPGRAESVSAAVQGLIQSRQSSTVLRGQALRWLAEHGSLPVVLSLGEQIADEQALRGPLVESLGQRLRCIVPQDPRWQTATDSLRTASLQPQWLTLLVLALTEAVVGCPRDEGRRQLSELIGAGWRSGAAISNPEQQFVLRYRLLTALARLELPETPALTREVLRDEKQPELRQLAARALARVSSLDSQLIQKVLSDSDAGVRAMLLTGLVGRRGDTLVPLVAPLLGSDPWPMVRRAAAEVVAGACQVGSPAVPVLERALLDADEAVASLSLSGLARCLGKSGLPRYQSLLTDGKSPPTVRGQACVLVARHGLADPQTASSARQAVGEGLSDLIDDPQAADRSLVAAVLCLRAVGEHGDGRDLGLLLSRLDKEAPLALRRGAMESVLKICQRQRSPLGKEDRQGLLELLRRAAEPSDSLLHGLHPKLKAQCEPWTLSR